MDFNSDNSSQNITLPTIGVVDKVLYTSVFSNNLISNLPITSGILTASNITASSNISIAGSLLQTNAACNIYIAGNVGIGTTIGTLNSNLNIFGTVNINSNLNAVSIFENGLSLTNKYQSNILANLTYQILRYPPVTLTSASTTLTGNSYGNGIYITSASSVAFGLGTYDSFTYPYTYGGWACTNSRYSSTYLGTVSTSITSIGNILGEWLQIQLPFSIKLNSYAILNSSQFKAAPSTWYLVGSTDQTTWYPIDYRTNITNWTNITSANQFIPNGANASSNYNYFRIIVTNVNGDVVLQIGQISLYSIYETIPSSATITTTNIGIGTTILNYPTSFSVVSGTSYFKNSIGIGTVPYNNSLLTISSTDRYNETIIVNNTNNQFGKCSINFNNSNFNAYIGIGGTGYTFQKYSSNLYIETTYSILFNAFGNNNNSIPSMVVSGISNVGIGTTTAGSNCLAVYGTSNYFSGSMGIGIAPSGIAGDLKLATMTASGTVNIAGAASLTNNLSVSGTSTLIGNVGIGTASVTAGAKLQVYGGPIYTLGIGISGAGNTGNPSTNAMGGNGDRIILWPGNGSVGGQPFSLGIGAGTMWYSVPAGNVHKFYVGGNQAILIDSNCNLTASGDLSLTRTNASITFVINGYNIAVPSTANYFSSNALANDMVIRSASNLMLQSGGNYAAIYINTSNNVGIGTASITTGAKLQVNGGPIFAAGVYPSVSGPTNGQMGGNGDRIVLWPGGPSAVPFSLGINSSNMWYSVPTSCTHIFYIGGNQAILIDSNCNLTVTCNILTNNKISIGSTNIFNANTLLTISSTNTANDTVVINNTLAAGTGKCSINFNNSNVNAYIGVGGTATNFSNYTSNLYLQTDKSIVFNAFGNVSNSTPSMVISGVSNVGIGTTNASTYALAVYGTSYFNNQVSMNNNLSVTGTSTLTNTITQTGGGAVSISGPTTFTSNLTQSGGTVTIGGATSLTNTITQTGGGAVSISGPTTFTSNLTQSGGTVTIGGAASLTNTITQTGGGAVSISGPTTFTSNLTQSGGTVTIGGATSLTNTITQTGGGDVSISGPTTFTSNLTQSGGTVTIGGTTSLTNTITQTGGGAVSISGPTTFTSNLTISTTNSNALSISNSSSTGLSTINLINNNNNKCYIGIGGTNTFNYSCNLYLQADNSIIFNTNGSFSTNSNPVMLLSSSNYVSVNDLWLNGQSIFYNNGEKQFPPRAYDSSPSSATYNTNASLFTFCNPTGTSVYTETLTYNGIGTYILYYSSINTNVSTTLKQKLFDFNYPPSVSYTQGTSGSGWASSGNYNIATGGYISSVYIVDSVFPTPNKYNGDWICIKFPSAIILTRFRFYIDSSNSNSAPGSWYCLGSMDGIIFNLIPNATYAYPNKLTTSNYIIGYQNYYEFVVTPIINSAYTYIVFVFSNLCGLSSQLYIAELQIFGIDSISTSLLNTWNESNCINYLTNSSSTVFVSSNTTSNTVISYQFQYNSRIKFNRGTEIAIPYGYTTITINPTNYIGKIAITGASSLPEINDNYSYPLLYDTCNNYIAPILWYKFDNSLINSGTYTNNDLTATNSPEFDFINYVKGASSILFATSNNTPAAVAQYLTINNSSNINFSNINLATGITFSFWVWTGAAFGSSGSYARFFDFGEQIVGGGSSNYISCFRNGTDASNIFFEIKTNNIANNTSNNLVTTTATWRFITWSISSSGTWNIYINASNIYTAINKGTIPTFQNTLASHQFNKSKYTADGSFYMNLDDFRVYATVLTSNQIYELYNSRIEIYQVAGVGIGTSTVNDNILNINGSIGLGTTATGSIGDFKCLTLTSSNVQSNYYMLYPPPYIFTTSPQTITSSYGSGQYTLTASSYISSVQAPWLAFNFPVSNSNARVCGQYASAYPYNSAAGLNRAYLNSGGATCNTAVIVSSLSASEVTSNIRGEWLQIQLPISIILTSYSITGPQTPLNKRSPSSWYLAGSIDNIKWYLIDNRTNINNWGSYANTTNTYSNINFTRNTSMPAYSLTPYNYYRIIITTVYNDPAVCIVKFGLYGYQNIPVSVSTNSIGIGTTSLSYGINSLSVYNGYSYFANNVGIGTNIPLQELHVQSPTPSMIRVETNVSAVDQVSGIEFGIPAFISNYSAKITSTSIAGNKANLQFYTPDGTNPSAVRLTITETGTTLNNSVGIGTTVSATYGLDIWFNGTNAVRIGNTTTVSTNNGYLILSGGTGGSGSLGFINFHTSNGTRQGYIGYGINTTNYIDLATENSFLGYRVNCNLLIGNKLGIGTNTILDNIKVGIYGGVVNITNTTPFAGTSNYMQPGSLIIGDTLLNYGNSTNWSSNTAGLLFECSNNTEIVVHDNATRLASLIQYLGDTSNRIIIGRDMGWGAISNIRLSSTTSIINGLTAFPSFGSNGSSGDKLVLWPGDATNYPYSIGIAGGTMWFGVPNGAKYHFYINSSNTPAVTIDSNSNFSTAGYIYAGGTTSGLRINGNDWGNTIYQNATGIGTNPADIGFTLRDNNSFNFWSYSSATVYTLMASINMNNISLLRTVGIGTTASFNANTLLTISSTNTLSNTVVINNTASAGNGKCSINFNNNNINAYIGLGGSSTGLAAFYNCNLLIQSDNAIVFSAFNTSPAATPPLMINSSGGIGIATTSCNISGLACALFVNGNYSYFVGNVGIGTNPSTNSVYPGGNLNAVSILENGLALTNKYQSFVNATYSNLNNQYQYPPASLTSSSTTLSGNVYGNFTYTVSASSSFSGNGPEYVFQYPNVYFWNINTPYPYTTVAGSLKSYALTTYGTSNIVNYSNIIYGEWIQIQYQNPIVIQSYSITGITGASYTRAPATWYLLGSVNTSNWYPIDYRSNITNWVSTGTTNTYSGFATVYNGPFNYYRIVVTQTAGDSGLAINQIIFNGYETNVVSTLRLYPPTSMNSSNTLISAQTYGNGTYIATQSSTYPTQLFFNTVSTTNNGQWTSAGNLYNASGIYTGAVSTTVNGTAYSGDWCQIILPVPIILTYYTLRSSTTGSGNNYNNSMFRKWILIGSNDGNSWTILDTRISSLWGQFESRSFSVTANYEYLSYYRIIILETNSSPVNGQIVLAGFYLYGFENLKSILTGPVGINTYPTLNNALTIGGNIGIGTTNANASIEIYSTNQLNAGLILSGQEYGSAPSVGNYTAGGIALLCGINISGNKQLWVTDSKNVGLNTSTAKAIRLICSTSVDNSIDCVGLDNATIKPIIFGNTGAITSIYGSGIYMNGSVGIGTAANTSYALSVYGAINLTSNPTNPGNNTSASFWNQANVGPTISGSAVSFQVNGTTEMARITLTNTIFYNNIGLGTTPPVGDKARLLVYEATGRDAAASGGGSLVLQHGNSGGVSSIVFASTVNYSSDFGYIKFYDNVQGTGFNYFGGTSTETAALVIGCENDGSSGAGPDSVILNPIGSVAIVPRNGVTYIDGSVGIGNTSPKLTLDVGYTNANHNIGRAILTAGNIHAADKLDFLSIGRWDGTSTSDWQFCGIKCGVITGAAAGESANNHSCITFHTWGNSVANSREVMRITSRGVLSGGVNVFKKIIFTFTPSYSSSPAGYYYYINISSYISSFVGGAGNNQFIFRMTISSTSGDFGDSGNNVNTISYNVFLAAWGGGGKCRIYQVFNSSSEAYLTWFDVQGTGAYQVYFWGGSNGGARYCILENIGTY